MTAGRPKIELTADESKLIASIPSARKAAQIWSRFEDRKIKAKEDRKALGAELVAVRKALGTDGKKTSHKGLFSRWLIVHGIPHDRAYNYMALAGGAKPKTQRKSYLRATSFGNFQKLLTNAKSNEEKKQILNELIKYVCHEYKIVRS
jgi:hypothetical protein